MHCSYAIIFLHSIHLNVRKDYKCIRVPDEGVGSNEYLHGPIGANTKLKSKPSAVGVDLQERRNDSRKH